MLCKACGVDVKNVARHKGRCGIERKGRKMAVVQDKQTGRTKIVNLKEKVL